MATHRTRLARELAARTGKTYMQALAAVEDHARRGLLPHALTGPGFDAALLTLTRAADEPQFDQPILDGITDLLASWSTNSRHALDHLVRSLTEGRPWSDVDEIIGEYVTSAEYPWNAEVAMDAALSDLEVIATGLCPGQRPDADAMLTAAQALRAARWPAPDPEPYMRCPYCGYLGTDDEVDDHRAYTHRTEPQMGSNLPA